MYTFQCECWHVNSLIKWEKSTRQHRKTFPYSRNLYLLPCYKEPHISTRKCFDFAVDRSPWSREKQAYKRLLTLLKPRLMPFFCQQVLFPKTSWTDPLSHLAIFVGRKSLRCMLTNIRESEKELLADKWLSCSDRARRKWIFLSEFLRRSIHIGMVTHTSYIT